MRFLPDDPTERLQAINGFCLEVGKECPVYVQERGYAHDHTQLYIWDESGTARNLTVEEAAQILRDNWQDQSLPLTFLTVLRKAAKYMYSGDEIKKYPRELTPELDEILGWSFIDCSQRAALFRKVGIDIPKKMEREVAYMKHWMLGFYFRYGKDWRKHALKEFNRIIAPLIAANQAKKTDEQNTTTDLPARDATDTPVH